MPLVIISFWAPLGLCLCSSAPEGYDTPPSQFQEHMSYKGWDTLNSKDTKQRTEIRNEQFLWKRRLWIKLPRTWRKPANALLPLFGVGWGGWGQGGAGTRSGVIPPRSQPGLSAAGRAAVPHSWEAWRTGSWLRGQVQRTGSWLFKLTCNWHIPYISFRCAW